MKKLFQPLIALSIVGLLFGCEPSEFHEGKFFAGEKYVHAKTLNKGKQIYMEYCIACHGKKGDGKGFSAKGMATPPRDFTLGLYKFGDVVAGELPHDKSIFKLLDHGLNGTAMLPWDLGQGQKNAVWQYIKTFAPKTWENTNNKLGKTIEITKDPYGLAYTQLAITKGREVYHVTATCQSCHRGYLTPKEYREMTKRLTGDAEEVDEEFYTLKPQESEYNYYTVPPDFTFHPIRSVRGTNIEEIYLRVSAGVGGTAMVSWKDTITDKEIWAVSYYIQSLMKMKDNPKRKKLIKKLGR